jgi:hypothetical protein
MWTSGRTALSAARRRGLPMNTELNGTLHQSEQVVARQIAGQWLLIPLRQTGVDLQKVYLLNETSAAIWRLLEKPVSFPELISKLTEEYAAPRELLETEAGEFVWDLCQRGFLTQERGRE